MYSLQMIVDVTGDRAEVFRSLVDRNSFLFKYEVVLDHAEKLPFNWWNGNERHYMEFKGSFNALRKLNHILVDYYFRPFGHRWHEVVEFEGP